MRGGGAGAMPGGKENAPPGTAEKKDDKKSKAGAKDDHSHGHGDDGIGPGDEKKGIAEVGWRLPCACTVLGGIHSTPRSVQNLSHRSAATLTPALNQRCCHTQ